MLSWVQRLMLFAAGIFGAAGVASAAMASHGEDVRNVLAISTISLAHAPALLALGLLPSNKAITGAGAVLALGCALFLADLALRQWLEHPLFPGAAPIGGALLILGWLGLAMAGLLSRR